MLLIKIPQNKNKLDFVYTLLNKMINSLNDLIFVNYTESPIKELHYRNYGNLYYRKLNTENIRNLINESNYKISYKLDFMNKQGYTLNDYIESCLLFELEKINILPEPNNKDLLNDIDKLNILATIWICPDGLNEIQITGNDNILNKISQVVNTFVETT